MWGPSVYFAHEGLSHVHKQVVVRWRLMLRASLRRSYVKSHRRDRSLRSLSEVSVHLHQSAAFSGIASAAKSQGLIRVIAFTRRFIPHGDPDAICLPLEQVKID